MRKTVYGVLAMSATILLGSTPAFAQVGRASGGIGSAAPGAVVTTTTSTGTPGAVPGAVPGAIGAGQAQQSTSITTTQFPGQFPNQFNPFLQPTTNSGLATGTPTSSGIPITPFNALGNFNGISGLQANPILNGFLSPASIVTQGGLSGNLFPGVGGMDGGTTGQAFAPMMQSPANPTRIHGPMEVVNTNPHATPMVLGTKKIVTGGVASTVTSPLVTEYHWGSPAVAYETRRNSYAQVVRRSEKRQSPAKKYTKKHHRRNAQQVLK